MCHMCGRETKKLTNRMYQYDNGEQLNAAVCAVCAELHDRLVTHG